MDWFEPWYESVIAFQPHSNQQEADQKMILDEARRRTDIFDRYSNPRHCTASAIIIGPRGIILHNHKKFRIWIQPGGHIDQGENPWDCALRESAEETGLKAVHPANGPQLVNLSCHQAGEHYHMDLQYLLLGEDRDPAPPEGESQEIGWFQIKEAGSIADPSLAGTFENVMRLDLTDYLTQID